MPFDEETFKRNRPCERTVKLGDGNEVIVHRPSVDIAIRMLNGVGHRLDPETLKALQKFQAQGADAAANINNAEYLRSQAADVWRILLAFIVFSPTEPQFVLDEKDERDGALWVERLTPNDVIALMAPIGELLGLTLPDVAVIAPFPESSGTEPSGGAVAGEPSERVAEQPASACDGHSPDAVSREMV